MVVFIYSILNYLLKEVANKDYAVVGYMHALHSKITCLIWYFYKDSRRLVYELEKKNAEIMNEIARLRQNRASVQV